MPKHEKWVAISVAAHALSLSYQAARNLALTGVLQSRRDSKGRWSVDWSSVVRFKSEREHAAV